MVDPNSMLPNWTQAVPKQNGGTAKSDDNAINVSKLPLEVVWPCIRMMFWFSSVGRWHENDDAAKQKPVCVFKALARRETKRTGEWWRVMTNSALMEDKSNRLNSRASQIRHSGGNLLELTTDEQSLVSR